MLGLVLAVALVGPPAPVVTAPVHTHEEAVDKAVGCGVEVVLWSAGDLYSTAWALDHNPQAYEANPLGFSVESRIATKMATNSLLVAGCYILERKHLHKEAKILRWLVRGAGTLLIINNVKQGTK